MTPSSHSLSPLEKTFFNQWIQALINAQQNPRVENHLVEMPVLRRLLAGLWNEVVSEINIQEQGTLSLKNKTARRELFERVIRQYPGRLLTDEGRIVEGGRDFWDRTEYLDFLFQTFEKILILSYPELHDGYSILQPYWDGEIDISIPFGYPGIEMADSNQGQEESLDGVGPTFTRLVPGAELIGLTCLFNLSPEKFFTTWTQMRCGGQLPTTAEVEQFKLEWSVSLERYTASYGPPLHDPQMAPSVPLEDFCGWLSESLACGGGLDSFGLMTHLHLKNEDLYIFFQQLTARHSKRSAWLSLGAGTRIYSGGGGIQTPLILTASLQIEPEWHDIGINEIPGEQAQYCFPEILRNEARNRLKYLLNNTHATADILREVTTADLTPGSTRSFTADQWDRLLALGVSLRPFNRQDIYPALNEDLPFYWTTNPGKDWVSPQGEPPASCLLGVWSPLPILNFSRSHHLSLVTPGGDGYTPLHRLFACCVEQRRVNGGDNGVIEALITCMTHESSQLLTKDGVSPLGVLIGDSDPLFIFERFPLSEKMIQHLDEIGVDFLVPQKLINGDSICPSQAFGLENHPLVERQKLRIESRSMPASPSRAKPRI